MNRKNFAVSPVIGTILMITIILTAVAFVMSWAIPQLEENKSNASQQNIENQFAAIGNSIGEMIQGGTGSNRIVDIGLNEGNYEISSVGDRFVMMYCTEEGANFTVSGLDDDDGEFTIEMSDAVSYTHLRAHET